MTGRIPGKKTAKGPPSSREKRHPRGNIHGGSVLRWYIFGRITQGKTSSLINTYKSGGIPLNRGVCFPVIPLTDFISTQNNLPHTHA
jgi:hypothetical protein